MTDFAKSLSSIPRLSAKTNKKYIKICDDAEFRLYKQKVGYIGILLS